MAQALAEAGADLILVGRSADSLRTARPELAALGRRIDSVVGDVGSSDGAKAVCDEALGLGRDIDIVINNVAAAAQISSLRTSRWRNGGNSST